MKYMAFVFLCKELLMKYGLNKVLNRINKSYRKKNLKYMNCGQNSIFTCHSNNYTYPRIKCKS